VVPFSQATATDGWLFLAGQMPTDPNDDDAPLPVGIEAQTRRGIENLKLGLAAPAAGSTKWFLRVSILRTSRAITQR
jgi:2-iminobutanoate/2-iminopropanoate deaminase